MALADILPPIYHHPPRAARVPIWRRHVRALASDEQPKSKPFAVLDIETGKAGDLDAIGGSFVVAAMRTWDSERITYYHDAYTLLCAVLAKSLRGYVVYAHNGAGYDFKYLLETFRTHADELRAWRVNILMRGDGRPLVIRFRSQSKHSVTLHDTFHFLPVSLDKAARTFSPELSKLTHEWSDGTYFDPESEQDMAYLRRDVDALHAVIIRYRALIWETFGVNLRITASATARVAWQRTLEPDTIYWRLHPQDEEFTRLAAHGGLIGLNTTRPQPNMTQADKHAHYADAMYDGVPSGQTCWTDRYVNGLPGCYECDVVVPLDERYPFIFTPKSGVRRGAFRTYLYSHEIAYARQLGYTIQIRRGVVWEHLIYPFTAFLKKCEALEIAHRGDAIGTCAKMLRNSLSGVFAKRPESERIIWTPDGELPPEATPLISELTGEILDGLGSLCERLDAGYMHPEWYGYHTATARLKTHAMARDTQAVYWDTDCACSPSREWLLRPDWFGEAYGMLAIEAEYQLFRTGGPKNVFGILLSGTERVRLKGIPTRRYEMATHVDALNGVPQSVDYVSVSGMKDIMRGRELQTVRSRSYSDLRRSTTWEQHEDGTVWAKVA